jgi:serine phosphatase RsbU (regulator of sigma subunit)
MSIATEVIPAEAYVGGDFFLLATSSPLSGAVRRSGLGLEVDCLDRVERLGAEDGVLLYTDGLVEARGGGSRYGTNRLSEVLRHGKRLTPPEILELLKRDLQEFAGERISDDVCPLALRGE